MWRHPKGRLPIQFGNDRFSLVFGEIAQSAPNAHWANLSYSVGGETFPLHREPWLLENLSLFLSEWIELLDQPLPLETMDEDQIAATAVLLHATRMSSAGEAAADALGRLLGRPFPAGTRPWDAHTLYRAYDLLMEAGGESTRIAFVLLWWPQPWFVAYRNGVGFSVFPVEVSDCRKAFASALAYIEALRDDG